MEELMSEKNCIYVFDKGYVDYKKFDKFTIDQKYFITRLKDNAVIEEVKILDITYSKIKLLDEGVNIIYDKIVFFGNKLVILSKI